MGLTVEQVVQTISAIGGATLVTTILQQWFERRKQKDQAEADHRKETAAAEAKRTDKHDDMTAEERRDAIGILREALNEKRGEHKECLARVEAVEKMVLEEREECSAQIATMKDSINHLTDVVIAHFGHVPAVRASIQPTK